VNAIRTISTLALAAVLLGGCAPGATGRGRAARTPATPAPIPTAAAKETTVTVVSSISGVIAPLQNVAITSSLSEPANAVNVSEGDHVRKGQVIAILDTADLQAQLAQANATIESDARTAASDDAKVTQQQLQARLNIGTGNDQVNSARSAVAQAQATLKNDQANLVRDRDLVTNGYISQQALDQQQTLVNNDLNTVRSAQAALQTANTNQQVNGNVNSGLQASNVQSVQAEANAARATIGVAQGQARQFQTMIAKATIVSPVNGVIVNRNLNPGEYPGGRTIFTIQELDQVYAELNASSSDTFSIPVGAPVTLAVAGASGNTYTGKVVAVLGQVTPGSTNFTVKVLVNNADGKLQSGLPVTANATLPAVKGVGIPSTAFLDDTHTTLWIADDQLVQVVAKKVTVHEVATDGKTSIVTGLKAGQAVITNGQISVTDGQTLASS
jgi:multidrug efflux pump subunit AcrA (membrane-fusion protein)